MQPRLDVIGLFEVDVRITTVELAEIAREKCDFASDAPLVCVEEITGFIDAGDQSSVEMEKTLKQSAIQDGDILVWMIGEDNQAALQELQGYYRDVFFRENVEFRDANAPEDVTQQFVLPLVCYFQRVVCSNHATVIILT